LWFQNWLAHVCRDISHKKKIYKCNMQQSRKTCVALYLEDEYEKLAMKAHFDYKWLEKPINNWPSFQYKFYKVCMKNKNTVFYHKMMNYCPTYKSRNLLAWNKNETKEIIKLGVKFNKTTPSWSKCPTSNEANVLLNGLHQIQHLGKWRLCHLHGLNLLKRTYA
jgi:hypothetical protein